ncbi:MAG: glycerol-3-phosphate acyltransferase [Candidatus Babeliales bacterium]
MKVILDSIILILAYIVGAFPTGVLLARWYGIDDITQHGSGNIGATNVGRKLGARGFITVFVGDAAKAWAYVQLVRWYGFSENTVLFVGVALLVGNSYSIFLQGKGGKGVATSMGILLALEPMVCLIVFLVWALFYWYLKIVGIASVGAYFILPLIAYFFQPLNFSYLLFMVFMSAWGIMRHYANIQSYIRKL